MGYSREIYDQMTAEILERKLEERKSSSAEWKNGLIIINTAFGRVNIRLASDSF